MALISVNSASRFPRSKSSGSVAILKVDEFRSLRTPIAIAKLRSSISCEPTCSPTSPTNPCRLCSVCPSGRLPCGAWCSPSREPQNPEEFGFELEDDIPFSQEDSIFDAKITNYVGGAAQVIAVATPEEYVQTKVQLAKDIGINLTTLTLDNGSVESLDEVVRGSPCAGRAGSTMVETMDGEETAVDVASPAKDKIEVLINMGHTNTTALFYKEGMFKAVRYMDWGGEQLGEEVSKKCSVHQRRGAQRGAKEEGLARVLEGATKDQIAFSTARKGGMHDLIHSLRLTFLEIESELNAEIVNGYVTGGVSQLKNICPFLTQSLEVAFNNFEYFGQFGHASDGQASGLQPRFAQSLSLAVEGLKKPRKSGHQPAQRALCHRGRWIQAGLGQVGRDSDSPPPHGSP